MIPLIEKLRDKYNNMLNHPKHYNNRITEVCMNTSPRSPWANCQCNRSGHRTSEVRSPMFARRPCVKGPVSGSNRKSSQAHTIGSMDPGKRRFVLRSNILFEPQLRQTRWLKSCAVIKGTSAYRSDPNVECEIRTEQTRRAWGLLRHVLMKTCPEHSFSISWKQSLHNICRVMCHISWLSRYLDAWDAVCNSGLTYFRPLFFLPGFPFRETPGLRAPFGLTVAGACESASGALFRAACKIVLRSFPRIVKHVTSERRAKVPTCAACCHPSGPCCTSLRCSSQPCADCRPTFGNQLRELSSALHFNVFAILLQLLLVPHSRHAAHIFYTQDVLRLVCDYNCEAKIR